jgi:hypothetical protein
MGNTVPEVADVAGSWAAEGSTLDLADDGTFTGTGIPISVFADGEGNLPATVPGTNSRDRTTSGGGTWGITDDRSGPYPVIELSFAPNTEVTAETTVRLLTSGSGTSRDVFFALGRVDGGVFTYKRP